ncbi:Bug family tripartite tricarboxylate transporter substrate binding protein [Reyranella sp.]|uniref:Bug family tripartite tricarboxylate transporter substrate binding protein n=1 Tax=Reyranella sp. TaxID=1929291 RepID=UPI003D12730D
MQTSYLARALRCLSLGLAVLALQIIGAPAEAQDWPAKPVKIVAPFAAGGNVDVTARIVAARLQAELGQPVVVENKTGAGAMIGSEFVARSAPDGYTLLMTSASLTNSPALFGRSPYDWQKDFTFITAVSFQPLVLLVNTSMPAKTMTEFLDLARKEAGKMTMGTAGAGSFTHLAGLLVEQRADVRFEPVHYRGTAPGLVDLMAGQIQFQFEPIATALPLLKDGKLRALAVTSLQRAPALPDVPTVAETIPGYEAINLLGLIAPAGLPEPVLAKLSVSMKIVLQDPAVIRRFDDLGTEARFTTPEAFSEIMRTQADTWIPVIRKANLKLE